MIICGIGIGYHPSLTLMEDGKIIYYNEERKVSKFKNISGIPYRCIDQINNYKLDEVYVTSYDWNKDNLLNLKNYLKYKKVLNKDKDVYSLYKPHHLSHMFKAYVDSKFPYARVFVLDGRGSKWGDGVEICSIYDVNLPEVNCIYKKIYNKYNRNIDRGKNETSINENTLFETTEYLSLGTLYAIVSEHFGFHNEEGKFMGLQSYGRIDQNLLKKFINGVNEKQLNEIPITLNAARTTQAFFEKEYLDLVKKYQSNYMVFTGGATLNVVNNYKIIKEFFNKNIYFEPLCGDEGNSIGAAYFHYLKKEQKIFTDNNIYLGQEITIDRSLLKNEFSELNVSTEDIINLLKNGEIVGLIQGKAEGGPRALGNRSLLLDPTLKDAKDKMNIIKKRENFRPFACSILEEKLNEFFYTIGISKSPHMMIAPQAKEKTKVMAPSIVHVDGTCRVQTVSEKDNKNLYKLLKNFKLPILMNTSLNLAGYPMVETFEDVLFTMRNSQLKYVFFADESKLLIKT